MRNVLAGLSAAALLAPAGCVVVAKVEDPCHFHGKTAVIEVDDEWYKVDVDAGTVKKFEPTVSVSVEKD